MGVHVKEEGADSDEKPAGKDEEKPEGKKEGAPAKDAGKTAKEAKS
jgi:hypothetical protein